MYFVGVYFAMTLEAIESPTFGILSAPCENGFAVDSFCVIVCICLHVHLAVWFFTPFACPLVFIVCVAILALNTTVSAGCERATSIIADVVVAIVACCFHSLGLVVEFNVCD